MSTLILDADPNDDLLFLNENQVLRYASPFAMDDLYLNNINNISPNESHLSEFSSEEDEDFDFKMLQPQAPPPSPQAKPMLDILFSEKLNASLEACMVNNKNHNLDPTSATNTATIYSNHLEQHAQTLDKLLRKTIKDEKHNSFKRSTKQKRNTSAYAQHLRKSSISKESSCRWQDRAQNQKLQHVAKATEYTDKLKKAFLRHQQSLEEEDIVNELRDMGL
ncbi:Antagonist of MEN (Mitotic Exit Network) [Mucor velutinosus]|uniref:Antagonist of MEN (Mitotic Exit Network) n=1 Tax=Mucor velutinosus TaxID=708070 RepID=A0AAN7DNB9_9FUNG|nr:Antagonist of MEN (Mitotic Exit Network) [Mucor velutinosus]